MVHPLEWRLKMQGTPALPGFKQHPAQEFNVEDFMEDENNVNEHSDIDLKATGASLDNFGQVETLVVDYRTKKVIGGNGRLRLMKQKGWKTFWAIPVEGTQEQIDTLAVTLNKTGKLSEFNYTKLSARLKDLEHANDSSLLGLTGFREHELGPLLASEMEFIASEDLGVGGPVEAEKKPKSDKNLDSRGLTVQFTVSQKPTIDAAITKFRGEAGDFSMPPAEAIRLICERYIAEIDTSEE